MPLDVDEDDEADLDDELMPAQGDMNEVDGWMDGVDDDEFADDD